MIKYNSVNKKTGKYVPPSIDKPCPVVSCQNRLGVVQVKFLSNYYYGHPERKNISKGGSVENPFFIFARIDKKPPYLIYMENKRIAIEFYGTDTEPMIRIKKFMVLYEIIDIKMRMLKIPELKRIMGFPENYKLVGTQADQKKFIGNAVEVNIARVLCEALVEELLITAKKAA
jgi:DNA (cytosine-5)-methyltransferase 1